MSAESNCSIQRCLQQPRRAASLIGQIWISLSFRFRGRGRGIRTWQSYFLEPQQSPRRDNLSNCKDLSFLRWSYKFTPWNKVFFIGHDQRLWHATVEFGCKTLHTTTPTLSSPSAVQPSTVWLALANLTNPDATPSPTSFTMVTSFLHQFSRDNPIQFDMEPSTVGTSGSSAVVSPSDAESSPYVGISTVSVKRILTIRRGQFWSNMQTWLVQDTLPHRSSCRHSPSE
jgi:hypothetical protein